jgi:hypothetical protein
MGLPAFEKTSLGFSFDCIPFASQLVLVLHISGTEIDTLLLFQIKDGQQGTEGISKDNTKKL